jgi:hypothetical protein
VRPPGMSKDVRARFGKNTRNPSRPEEYATAAA